MPVAAVSLCVLCPCVCGPAPLTGLDVSTLVRALRRLCSHPSASLAHLNLGLLPHGGLIKPLLAAAPRVTDLQVEVDRGSRVPPRVAESEPAGELKLQPKGSNYRCLFRS